MRLSELSAEQSLHLLEIAAKPLLGLGATERDAGWRGGTAYQELIFAGRVIVFELTPARRPQLCVSADTHGGRRVRRTDANLVTDEAVLWLENAATDL